MIDIIFNGITSLFLSKLTLLFINAVAIYLAVIVRRDNRRGEINKIYVVMTFLMLCWVDFAYIPRYLVTPIVYPLSLLLLKVAWLATPLFFFFIYYLTIILIQKKEKYKILTRVVLFLSLVSAVMAGFTSYITEGLEVIDGIVTIIYGSWMYPFLAIILLIIIATLFPIFKKDILRDDKIRHFLMGIFIFYFANFVFNITLPIFFGISRFYFFGDYSTLILLSYAAYSILKHELFEIKVVAAEALTFFIWLALATEILTAERIQDKVMEIVVFVLIIFFGILLIRSVKSEIRHAEALEKVTKQLKIANLKLKKLDAAKSEFISIASHQLRTPLTVIKGYISMIRAGDFGKLAEKIVDPLEKVYESSNRLILLVENMLNVSRIESGRTKFNFVNLRLENLVTSVVGELESKAKIKNVKLNYKNPLQPLPEVKVDEEKMRQVIMNLIENAVKYTDKGSVDVDIKQAGKNLEFCVVDSGAGIRLRDLGKLFQKFSRGTGKTQAVEGTGLGLYVAKQMIEAHKGKVWAESEGEGKGSKFCFHLPINK